MDMHNSFGDNIAGNKIIYSLSENECDPVEIANQYPRNDKLAPDLQELLTSLEENKIVFISGGVSDKKQIARQLALQLKASKSKNNFSAFEIFSGCVGSISITDRIYKKNLTGCFVLQGMRPENLVDCYDDFELLKNEDLYFIVTTDEPKAFWSFSDNFNNAWREINDGDIYSNEQLKDFALDEIKELEQSERLILRGVNKEEIRQSIFEKVNSLNSIVRRKQFLQEVARRSKVLGAENNFDFLDSLCEQAHNDVQSFQLWFDYSLNDEDRMLVIGLSAFYGMSAEQTFAMLDRVVDEVWRPRRSNLPYYDYGDIQKISTHFEVIGHNIELKNDRFPNAVFKYCWEKHRRLLTTLLPVAVKVSKESFEVHKKENRGLFGTKIKKEKLRITISLFLSRVASLDFEAIKEHLVDLITAKNDGAVSIAAHVIAYVYRDGNSELKNEIDTLLYDWLDKNAINYKNMMMLLKEELVHKDDRETIPESRLQVLLAYTLMYVFRQYGANTVPEHLKQLLFDLIDNSSAEVHKTLGATVLPSVYSAHFDQFYNKIEWLAHKNTLQDAVAALMAKNFGKHHDSIWQLLESWFTSPLGKINQSDSLDNKKLILTSLKILEKAFKLDRQTNNVDKIKIINLLNKGIREVNDSAIRISIFDMMLDLAEDDSTNLDIRVQETISYLDAENRQQMVDIISNKYMAQRESLSGGDLKKEINGKYYQLWLYPEVSPRPSLPIERMVDGWLENSVKKEVIQIAYLSQSNFIKIFEKKEKEVIEKILEERQFGFDKVNNGSLELPDIIRHVLIDLDKNGVSNSFSFSEWYAEIISIPLQIAKKYPYEEKTIRAILPVILSQVEEERNDMLYRLNINGRWELADAIRVVIYSDRNKFFVIMGVVIIFLVLLIIFNSST